jgi:hypothetical protein
MILHDLAAYHPAYQILSELLSSSRNLSILSLGTIQRTKGSAVTSASLYIYVRN